MSAQLHTVQMRLWIQRFRAGDLAAREELLRTCVDRLRQLASKILRTFPNVRRWADTDDVLQGALLRLLRSLEKIEPASTRMFFGLAAEEIRRELLDLARRLYGPHGLGRNHASHSEVWHDGRSGEPEADVDDQGDVELWCLFHRSVNELAEEEREVVNLVYYHGWRPEDAAQVLGVSARTVRRRWQSALVRLHGIIRQIERL